MRATAGCSLYCAPHRPRPEEQTSGVISVVVPVYNEREVLPELHRRVTGSLAGIGHRVEIVLVDDGSEDGSTEMIRELAEREDDVVGVRLSRNFGHEAAIEAGLHEASGDAVIVMDADLQDAPEALPTLIAHWEAGVDVAYAVRRDRKEGPVQRAAFAAFYRVAARIVEIDLPKDAGPFSLMSRPVVDAINAMGERGRYFPGLRAFAGFRQLPVEVERHARHAGTTKYSLRRRTSGALNAIFSFSKLPLRAVSMLGFVAAAVSVVGAVWVVIGGVASDTGAPGWVSLMTVVLLVSGVQLVTLGIVGEYVGKVYDEVRARPNFIVAQRWGRGEDPRVPSRDGDTPETMSRGA
jgi:polyisoprenyl-phosphate glycosyltransferase